MKCLAFDCKQLGLNEFYLLTTVRWQCYTANVNIDRAPPFAFTSQHTKSITY